MDSYYFRTSLASPPSPCLCITRTRSTVAPIILYFMRSSPQAARRLGLWVNIGICNRAWHSVFCCSFSCLLSCSVISVQVPQFVCPEKTIHGSYRSILAFIPQTVCFLKSSTGPSPSPKLIKSSFCLFYSVFYSGFYIFY